MTDLQFCSEQLQINQLKLLLTINISAVLHEFLADMMPERNN